MFITFYLKEYQTFVEFGEVGIDNQLVVGAFFAIKAPLANNYFGMTGTHSSCLGLCFGP